MSLIFFIVLFITHLFFEGVGGVSGPGAVPSLPAEVHQGQPGQQEGQNRVSGQTSVVIMHVPAVSALPAEVHQGQPGQQEGQDRVSGQASVVIAHLDK